MSSQTMENEAAIRGAFEQLSVRFGYPIAPHDGEKSLLPRISFGRDMDGIFFGGVWDRNGRFAVAGSVGQARGGILSTVVAGVADKRKPLGCPSASVFMGEIVAEAVAWRERILANVLAGEPFRHELFALVAIASRRPDHRAMARLVEMTGVAPEFLYNAVLGGYGHFLVAMRGPEIAAVMPVADPMMLSSSLARFAILYRDCEVRLCATKYPWQAGAANQLVCLPIGGESLAPLSPETMERARAIAAGEPEAAWPSISQPDAAGEAIPDQPVAPVQEDRSAMAQAPADSVGWTGLDRCKDLLLRKLRRGVISSAVLRKAVEQDGHPQSRYYQAVRQLIAERSVVRVGRMLHPTSEFHSNRGSDIDAAIASPQTLNDCEAFVLSQIKKGVLRAIGLREATRRESYNETEYVLAIRALVSKGSLVSRGGGHYCLPEDLFIHAEKAAAKKKRRYIRRRL